MNSHDGERVLDDIESYLPDAPTHSTRGLFDASVTTDFYERGIYRSVTTPEWNHHLICVNLSGIAELTQMRRRQVQKTRHQPGSIIVVPAGASATWDGRTTPSARFRIPPDTLARAAEDAGAQGYQFQELRDIFQQMDKQLARYASILQHEITGPAHRGQGLIVQSISDAIVAHIVHRYSTGTSDKLSRQYKLDRRAIASVSRFVEDRLGASIELDEMAAVAGISRFYFSRSFKASTGSSPMQFVEKARVRRATELMREGSLSLAEIAAALGFADQSHFTRRFRRQTGYSPAVYARQMHRTGRVTLDPDAPPVSPPDVAESAQDRSISARSYKTERDCC